MLPEALGLAVTTFGIGAGGGAGFLIIKWLFEYLGGRMDKRADRIDAGTDKLIERLERQVAGLIDRGEQLESRLKVVEDDLAECKRRHSESDAEVTRLKAAMAGMGDARQHAALIVAAEKKADQ